MSVTDRSRTSCSLLIPPPPQDVGHSSPGAVGCTCADRPQLASVGTLCHELAGLCSFVCAFCRVSTISWLPGVWFECVFVVSDIFCFGCLLYMLVPLLLWVTSWKEQNTTITNCLAQLSGPPGFFLILCCSGFHAALTQTITSCFVWCVFFLPQISD